MEPFEFIFTFDSVKGAISGEKKLRDAGVAVMVMPPPRRIASRCGICLRVLPGELAVSEEALRGDYSGIYSASWADPQDQGLSPGSAAETVAMENRKVFAPWTVHGGS